MTNTATLPASKQQVVILGADVADATSMYHFLRANEPERVVGKNVRIVLPMTLGLDGLRVHDYLATERAIQHPNYEQLKDALGRAFLLTQNGAQ